MQVQRINITLPQDLISELKMSVPTRSRSKFIAKTLRAQLNKKRSLREEFARSLKLNKKFYQQINKQIEEDFKYADADILAKLP